MEVLALTCPQCGSSAIKLIPERNDLAQCNYCSALFMLPPPTVTEEPKPEITEEQEEVDMTEVVYPVKPTPPSTPVAALVLAFGLIMAGLICGINELAKWKPDHQQLIGWGTLFLMGIGIFSITYYSMCERQKEYTNSVEMQEYIKANKAAFDKAMAQYKRRNLKK